MRINKYLCLKMLATAAGSCAGQLREGDDPAGVQQARKEERVLPAELTRHAPSWCLEGKGWWG